MNAKPGKKANSTSSEQLSLDKLTRQRIIDTARHHFFAFGFRAVTMDDIAAELAMSKKTLYSHFRSKAELLQAAVIDKQQAIEADLKRITSQSSSDSLAAIQQLLAKMQQHLGEIHPAFMRNIRREAPDLFEFVEIRRRDLIHRYFGKILAQGRRAGIIRKDIPIRLIIETWLGVVEAIMNPEKLTELNLTPEEGFSAVISVILKGLMTAEGRAKL
jgi:AcrR family transcriptional regulator